MIGLKDVDIRISSYPDEEIGRVQILTDQDGDEIARICGTKLYLTLTNEFFSFINNWDRQFERFWLAMYEKYKISKYTYYKKHNIKRLH